MKKTQTHEIEIRVPVEDAWRALTDPDELARWFAEEASIEPREGGAYQIGWEEGAVGRRRIAVWEPGRRLRLVGEPSPDGQLPLDEPLVEDWVLEQRGGSTVVRLVESGFPDTGHWNGVYDSMELGWGLFFRGLRHYLERHRGRARVSRYFTARTARAPERVWTAVTGPDALAADGSLPPAGERYEITTADGDRLSGEVVHHEPGRSLQLTIEPLDDALLTLAVEGDDDETLAWGTVATFGEARHEPADRLAGRIRRLISADG